MRQSLARVEALALSTQVQDVKWSALVEDTVSLSFNLKCKLQV
jgi:hypothetical protein